MSALGLRVFDRTIQETNEWLQQLEDELETESRQAAYHALRSVLFTLRDRLPVELSAHLGAQLPLLVRGIYYESYKPNEQPMSYRTRDEWLEHVNEHYNVAQHANAEEASRAVFTLLSDRLSDGVVQKVRGALPEKVRTLWPDVPKATAQGT